MTRGALSREELKRYRRHLQIPEIGLEGQERLKGASVLVVGAGGLGSPATLYLAAAGVGRLGMMDFDEVDITNLQRQILHGAADVGRPKLDSAGETLAALNPHVELEPRPVALSPENALAILERYDVIVDGTDNFATRYLVNDACVMLGKPNVHGSVFRFEGQASVFHAPTGPCYRCLFPSPPPADQAPTCAEGGVLGVLPGIIGALQANEAIKLCLGLGDTLSGRLLLVDALELTFREVRIRKDPQCPVCGEAPSIRELIDHEAFCGSADEGLDDVPGISVTELARRRAELVVVDVREPYEKLLADMPGTVLIPLRELPDRLDELDRGADLALLCRSGVRSARALKILEAAGFEKVRNIRGGILAWGEEVDPAVEPY